MREEPHDDAEGDGTPKKSSGVYIMKWERQELAYPCQIKEKHNVE
jgi:hypothetical protein